ncbi:MULTISPECIES: hypothetical protein [unclassified Curtobacterium]|uniref:hypothetical protein n=1 Tax=unclassified Curtobacterium TaxID=257496 RepID=UPI000FA510D7|nr:MULTISPECIES: hypothetical protein [unclassified Curtobacterium]ROQ05144.1 hypothetical protein EDF41_3268 [Curtobacterium sp. PhB171]ROQ22345.1 hypothetical protein EDF40_3436 [Curtobacterium sp. PhB170]ROS33705.1 hypothetical protein EDF25_3091 [Curtobacterium sp. PhB131]ROS65024.1 hypothetical protein EDF30_3445 [Curtobacterium sp. PhB141]
MSDQNVSAQPEQPSELSRRATSEEARAAYAAASNSAAAKMSLIQLIARSCTDNEVCATLGCAQVDLSTKLAASELQAFDVAGTRLFPAWQFTDSNTIPSLAELLAVARDVTPVTLAGFMDRPQGWLLNGGAALSPRDWLRLGHEPQIVYNAIEGWRRR